MMGDKIGGYKQKNKKKCFFIWFCLRFALSLQRKIKERTVMNTLTIDQAVYDGAALYARQNNMSVQKVIELGVKLLLDNVRHSNTKTNDMELEQALKYVSTLSAKGGRIVPVDENGRDARIEKYVR